MAHSIVRKIEKLLRLAEKGDVHEAANAASKAKQIAEKYNIALDILKERGKDVYLDSIINYKKVYDKPFREDLNQWEQILLNTIGLHNNCRVFIEFDGKNKWMNIAGRSSDIEIVNIMFSSLRTQITNLIISNKLEGPERINSYCVGVIHFIDQKIISETEKMRENIKNIPGVSNSIERISNRIFEVDEFLEEENLDPEDDVKFVCAESFQKGYSDGKLITTTEKFLGEK